MLGKKKLICVKYVILDMLNASIQEVHLNEAIADIIIFIYLKETN